jgi:ActR/RegA family two-component response regulator
LAEQFLENNTDAKQIGEFLNVQKITGHAHYPSHAQTIAAMLGTESSIHSEFYTPEAAEHMDSWEKISSNLFITSQGISATERKSDIVRNTLNTMRLNH